MPELDQIIQSILNLQEYGGIDKTIKGVEKESLRIDDNYSLAMSPHPQALGSALTHPHITTDYSEALLEFITQPYDNTHAVINELKNLHAYTYQNIGNERLWATSMPCALGEDKDIPIAYYGKSNSGKMRSVYRMGLGHRYGRSMQTIAGVHYNFSIPDSLWQHLHNEENSALSLKDFKTQGYFRLIRNFRRYFWLLLYLFGASPSVCKSFVKNRQHQLIPFGDDMHSLCTPFATSLRMGDLGYQSKAQNSLVLTYNCLQSYIQTLCCAITTAHPDYVKTGVYDANNDEYRQLNANLLQIENEFYSVIRPKRTAQRGETALSALANRGVEYIEVRCLDIDPYDPIGISAEQMDFLDTFLLYCALKDSPASDKSEYLDIQDNQKRMVYHGRDPELKLHYKGKSLNIRQWGNDLLQELQSIANLLDTASNSHKYSSSLSSQSAKLANDSLTPSARVLNDMKNQGLSFYQLACEISRQHADHFRGYDLQGTQDTLLQAAQESIKQQGLLESSDQISFDDYLKNYYSQYQCASEA